MFLLCPDSSPKIKGTQDLSRIRLEVSIKHRSGSFSNQSYFASISYFPLFSDVPSSIPPDLLRISTSNHLSSGPSTNQTHNCT